MEHNLVGVTSKYSLVDTKVASEAILFSFFIDKTIVGYQISINEKSIYQMELFFTSNESLLKFTMTYL